MIDLAERNATATAAKQYTTPVSDKPRLLDQMRALIRRARKRAGLHGIVFHDTRHTAATWLAPKLHVLDLCRMFGWANPKQAMVYYNPSAADIARRIG